MLLSTRLPSRPPASSPCSLHFHPADPRCSQSAQSRGVFWSWQHGEMLSTKVRKPGTTRGPSQFRSNQSDHRVSRNWMAGIRSLHLGRTLFPLVAG